MKQLRTTFAFKGFRTADTLVVRSRDKQKADVRGLAKLDPHIPSPSNYTFSYQAASIYSDEKAALSVWMASDSMLELWLRSSKRKVLVSIQDRNTSDD